MRRREFLGVLGGGAAWPLAARAQQQPAMPVVGFLSAVSPAGFEARVREFRLGLKDAGYVEGENVSIEYRWAENRLDRLPALGGELVRQKVAVIVATGGTAAAIAAKGLNTTIPVIFGIPEDPVKLGLVMNLARPGANMTGVNFFTGEVLAKRLELLRELVPTAVRVAVFVNPANPERAATQVKELEAAAGATGLQLRVYNTGSVRDINLAFATLARERPHALFVSADPLFVVRRVQLANLAARHAMPSSFSVRDIVDAGGLMSYGTNISDAYRQIGVYAGRVLKGTKPADLPVLQSTKFELVINAQTATMLGLTVPSSLLALADEVIE
jgi:putative tryptophan/tyrosine transport system substrate-binding protein